MNPITEYLILSARSNPRTPAHESLMAAVTAKLAEGYQPLGGPFIGVDMMYQALVINRNVEPIAVAVV